METENQVGSGAVAGPVEDVVSTAPRFVRTPMNSDCSEAIDQLVAALSKAQGEIVAAEKGEKNPHFEKSYADLADVWAACRAPLSANGLAVLQIPRLEDKFAVVRCVLAHASGQFIVAELPAPVQQMTPQGIGSAITYLRRYTLGPMVGVAPKGDDDDGEGGTGPRPPAHREEAAAPRTDKASTPPREKAAPRASKATGPDPAAVALAAEFDRRIKEVADLAGQADLRVQIRTSETIDKGALIEASFQRSIEMATTPAERKPLASEIQNDPLDAPAKARLHKAYTERKVPPVSPAPAPTPAAGGTHG